MTASVEYETKQRQQRAAQERLNEFHGLESDAALTRVTYCVEALAQVAQYPQYDEKHFKPYRLFIANKSMLLKYATAFEAGDVGIGYLRGNSLDAWSLRDGGACSGWDNRENWVTWLEQPVQVSLYATPIAGGLQCLRKYMPQDMTDEQIIEQALQVLLDAARRLKGERP